MRTQIHEPALTLSLALALAAFGLPGAPTAVRAEAAGSVTFTVHVENVSTVKTLRLSTGATAPAPTSPVFWTVFSGTCPLFTPGKADQGWGLEALAEDGNPTGLVAKFTGMADHAMSGAVAVPNGEDKPGPILPGKSFDFKFTAKPGEKLMLAMMFGQSNDLFYAPDGSGIDLFGKNGKPVTGNLTSKLLLWDAGTEVNEEPGLGADQGPRQKGPNTGQAENGPVRLVKDTRDGFRYPATNQVLKVVLTADRTVNS